MLEWCVAAAVMVQASQIVLSICLTLRSDVVGEGMRLFAVLRKINFHLQKMKRPSKILT